MCCLSLFVLMFFFGVLVFAFDAIVINNNAPATCLNLFDTRRQNANQQLNFLAGGTTTKEVASQLNRADHLIHSRERHLCARTKDGLRRLGSESAINNYNFHPIHVAMEPDVAGLTFWGPRLFSFGKDPSWVPRVIHAMDLYYFWIFETRDRPI